MFALLRRPLLAHFGEQFPGFLEGAQAHEGLRELQLAVDRGGLGDFAIRYGHDRNMLDVTNVTVLVLVIIVCIMEFVGGKVVKKNTH